MQILQTTDIHSYIDEGEEAGKGGLLRVASLIKTHRQKFGENNTILIDCGDAVQGDISGIVSRGEAAVELINHLRYDFWILGNHELDFGISRLYQLVNKTTVPILAGNFQLKSPYEKQFAAWKIVTKNNAKICVIGMQASFLEEWFTGGKFQHYQVEKAFDTISREMPKILKEKPHMIILAIHQGFLFNEKRGVNEIREIAQRFPEIDLILGGHTHQSHPGKNIFGVYYSQAAYHASHLGVVEAEIDLDSGVKSLSAHLLEATAEIPKDKEAEEVYLKWRQNVNDFSNKPVANLPADIPSKGKPGSGCKITEIICQSIKDASQSDFALHGKFTSAHLPKNTTENDLHQIIPYENFIFKLTVTPEQLHKLIEEQIQFIDSKNYNAPYGFEIVLSQDKKLKEIKVPQVQKTYTIAINSRVAAGGGGRFPWLKEEIASGRIPVEEIETNTRDAIKNFLNKTYPVSPK